MICKLIVIGLVFTAFALPQSDDLDKAFSELQRVWRTADRAAAAKLFSDDLSFITRSGVPLKKQQLLPSFQPGGGTMEKIAEKTTRLYGDVAVLTFKDGEGESAARRTIVWHKTQQGWKIVSMQATPIRQ